MNTLIEVNEILSHFYTGNTHSLHTIDVRIYYKFVKIIRGKIDNIHTFAKMILICLACGFLISKNHQNWSTRS